MSDIEKMLDNLDNAAFNHDQYYHLRLNIIEYVSQLQTEIDRKDAQIKEAIALLEAK